VLPLSEHRVDSTVWWSGGSNPSPSHALLSWQRAAGLFDGVAVVASASIVNACQAGAQLRLAVAHGWLADRSHRSRLAALD
jgi:hypothetical protein